MRLKSKSLWEKEERKLCLMEIDVEEGTISEEEAGNMGFDEGTYIQDNFPDPFKKQYEELF